MNTEHMHRMVLDHVSDGVYFVDQTLKITYWNKAAEKLTGYRADEVIGTHCPDNLLRHVDENGTMLCVVGCPLSATLRDGKEREVSVFLHHKEGYRLPVQVRAMPVRDDAGRVIGAVETFSDNRRELALLDRLAIFERQALIDPLTNLANRRAAEEELEARLSEYRRTKRDFGLLFLDIDHFKAVNDTHGHTVGDKLLRVVGSTIRHGSRAYDLPSRWGGEEFVIVAPNIDAEALLALAERHRVLVASSSINVGDGRLGATVSIGGSVVRADDQRHDLIQRADHFMYQSKDAGRNRVMIG